jgi:hypothetical protein
LRQSSGGGSSRQQSVAAESHGEGHPAGMSHQMCPGCVCDDQFDVSSSWFLFEIFLEAGNEPQLPQAKGARV